MSFWLYDPELFLYAKGNGSDDVHLWRCKKPASSSSSSSLVVPMKSDDFDYVSNVKNHLELIDELFYWDETDYKRLVKYIYEKRLLVNGQGFVIAELHKADKDENRTINDANEEDVAAAIYIRSLDVLPLKSYMPSLRERPIPSRTVKYLGDVNGRTALMEKDSNARVGHLEYENISLKSKNSTLETIVTKLTERVAHLEAENTRLESKNNTLEGKLTKSIADLVTQTNASTTFQRNNQAWMNGNTNTRWIGVEGFKAERPFNITVVGPRGTFTRDDDSTNVQARYWYRIKLGSGHTEFRAVSLEELTPYKESARFTRDWYSTLSKGNGKPYVFRGI